MLGCFLKKTCRLISAVSTSIQTHHAKARLCNHWWHHGSTRGSCSWCPRSSRGCTGLKESSGHDISKSIYSSIFAHLNTSLSRLCNSSTGYRSKHSITLSLQTNGLSSDGKVSAVHAVLTMGAPGVLQLVGATCGVQLAPPVSFFSLWGSLNESNSIIFLPPLYLISLLHW